MGIAISCDNLISLRNNLLHLHKALLDFQKKEYEGKFGMFKSVGQYFSAVTENPSFAWLRKISEIIVSMDEIIDAPESQTQSNILALFEFTKKLLTPDPEGTEFEKKYRQAIQKDPAVALSHAKVMKIVTSSV